ncbi:MAG: hypothetical protein P857_596 [Candidatus Xenolissoclinum pacificiensis L6]|uniref:Uncharacterized protein n=1 Tax=Candidatus Xenolissoclinum pacificiensis L6 TaxID=1401685 RepID=W2UZ13_9RICK|nr:MAG: hypothetical protein P857_596 [Candidatus Xenolissoclinum pacificiensis L6]
MIMINISGNIISDIVVDSHKIVQDAQKVSGHSEVDFGYAVSDTIYNNSISILQSIDSIDHSFIAHSILNIIIDSIIQQQEILKILLSNASGEDLELLIQKFNDLNSSIVSLLQTTYHDIGIINFNTYNLFASNQKVSYLVTNTQYPYQITNEIPDNPLIYMNQPLVIMKNVDQTNEYVLGLSPSQKSVTFDVGEIKNTLYFSDILPFEEDLSILQRLQLLAVVLDNPILLEFLGFRKDAISAIKNFDFLVINKNIIYDDIRNIEQYIISFPIKEINSYNNIFFEFYDSEDISHRIYFQDSVMQTIAELIQYKLFSENYITVLHQENLLIIPKNNNPLTLQGMVYYEENAILKSMEMQYNNMPISVGGLSTVYTNIDFSQPISIDYIVNHEVFNIHIDNPISVENFIHFINSRYDIPIIVYLYGEKIFISEKEKENVQKIKLSFVDRSDQMDNILEKYLMLNLFLVLKTPYKLINFNTDNHIHNLSFIYNNKRQEITIDAHNILSLVNSLNDHEIFSQYFISYIEGDNFFIKSYYDVTGILLVGGKQNLLLSPLIANLNIGIHDQQLLSKKVEYFSHNVEDSQYLIIKEGELSLRKPVIVEISILDSQHKLEFIPDTLTDMLYFLNKDELFSMYYQAYMENDLLVIAYHNSNQMHSLKVQYFDILLNMVKTVQVSNYLSTKTYVTRYYNQYNNKDAHENFLLIRKKNLWNTGGVSSFTVNGVKLFDNNHGNVMPTLDRQLLGTIERCEGKVFLDSPNTSFFEIDDHMYRIQSECYVIFILKNEYNQEFHSRPISLNSNYNVEQPFYTIPKYSQIQYYSRDFDSVIHIKLLEEDIRLYGSNITQLQSSLDSLLSDTNDILERNGGIEIHLSNYQEISPMDHTSSMIVTDNESIAKKAINALSIINNDNYVFVNNIIGYNDLDSIINVPSSVQYDQEIDKLLVDLRNDFRLSNQLYYGIGEKLLLEHSKHAVKVQFHNKSHENIRHKYFAYFEEPFYLISGMEIKIGQRNIDLIYANAMDEIYIVYQDRMVFQDVEVTRDIFCKAFEELMEMNNMLIYSDKKYNYDIFSVVSISMGNILSSRPISIEYNEDGFRSVSEKYDIILINISDIKYNTSISCFFKIGDLVFYIKTRDDIPVGKIKLDTNTIYLNNNGYDILCDDMYDALYELLQQYNFQIEKGENMISVRTSSPVTIDFTSMESLFSISVFNTRDNFVEYLHKDHNSQDIIISTKDYMKHEKYPIGFVSRVSGMFVQGNDMRANAIKVIVTFENQENLFGYIPLVGTEEVIPGNRYGNMITSNTELYLSNYQCPYSLRIVTNHDLIDITPDSNDQLTDKVQKFISNLQQDIQKVTLRQEKVIQNIFNDFSDNKIIIGIKEAKLLTYTAILDPTVTSIEMNDDQKIVIYVGNIAYVFHENILIYENQDHCLQRYIFLSETGNSLVMELILNQLIENYDDILCLSGDLVKLFRVGINNDKEKAYDYLTQKLDTSISDNTITNLLEESSQILHNILDASQEAERQIQIFIDAQSNMLGSNISNAIDTAKDISRNTLASIYAKKLETNISYATQ